MLVLASSCLGGNREAGWNWFRNDGDAGWKAPVELSRSFKFTEAARFKPHRKGPLQDYSGTSRTADQISFRRKALTSTNVLPLAVSEPGGRHATARLQLSWRESRSEINFA